MNFGLYFEAKFETILYFVNGKFEKKSAGNQTITKIHSGAAATRTRIKGDKLREI